jgi:hypothetical protein
VEADVTHGELAAVLESHGRRVRYRQGGRGFMAQCFVHPDGRHFSLAVGVGRDGLQRLMYCHAGCSFDEVRVALGLPREAFRGWKHFKREKLSTTPTASLTLSISGVRVIDAERLLRRHRSGDLEPSEVVLPLPPCSRRVAWMVAADMELLFGLADSGGVGRVPLLYGARWAADRLAADSSSVFRALRALQEHGAIERTGGVVSRSGRATRTYRRPR